MEEIKMIDVINLSREELVDLENIVISKDELAELEKNRFVKSIGEPQRFGKHIQYVVTLTDDKFITVYTH
jgi:hypothetical protein